MAEIKSEYPADLRRNPHCGGINADVGKIDAHVERIRKKITVSVEQKLIAELSHPSQSYVPGDLSTMKLSNEMMEQERDFEEFMACVAELEKLYFIRSSEEKSKGFETDFKWPRTTAADLEIERRDNALLELVKRNRAFTKAVKMLPAS